MMESTTTLFEIAKHLSERYPLPLETAAIDAEAGDMADDGDWLLTQHGPGKVPAPPMLDTDRIRDLARRGLLSPGKLGEAEVRELAASIVSHLAREGR